MIERLLVANRGEIALRVFRTCREAGIATVAVFSDVDRDAPFVRAADAAVALGGATPAESYLRGDALVGAALRARADAVHPGYGFLAENAGFAQAVLDAGLIWVGPPPAAISAMGSKIEARERMEAVGVPVLPGRPVDGSGDLESLAAEVGYPLLVKASAGGGGKGIRAVADATELAGAVEAVRREAAAAFGDAALFLERYLAAPRHVEVQIFGDQHGRIVSLFERDCSVQRRHQKVVEEAPCPVLDAATRQRMSAAAIAAGEALGYVGAGTVEFLLAPGGEFFFLEVNTRLQVEHPVTELVTGLDLVALQLHVAEGRPLPPEALAARISGHAVEARVYAEDPARDFLPVTGLLERFAVPEGVRVDTGVADGSEISPYYDPMIAKVVAHGATRGEALRRLAGALRRAELHGITTNRDFLVRVLSDPDFVAGRTDTHFLERDDLGALAAPLVDADDERLHAVAAVLAAQSVRRRAARVLGTLPTGWRNVPSALHETVVAGPHGERRVGYRFDRAGELDVLCVDGVMLRARLHGCSGGTVDLEADGVLRHFRVRPGEGQRLHVNSADGQVTFQVHPRLRVADDQVDTGSLMSPMPGAVLRIMVSEGETVEAGQPLLILEAMKMEHEVVAPVGGMLASLLVAQGDQVHAGAVLAIVEEDD